MLTVPRSLWLSWIAECTRVGITPEDLLSVLVENQYYINKELPAIGSEEEILLDDPDSPRYVVSLTRRALTALDKFCDKYFLDQQQVLCRIIHGNLGQVNETKLPWLSGLAATRSRSANPKAQRRSRFQVSLSGMVGSRLQTVSRDIGEEVSLFVNRVLTTLSWNDMWRRVMQLNDEEVHAVAIPPRGMDVGRRITVSFTYPVYSKLESIRDKTGLPLSAVLTAIILPDLRVAEIQTYVERASPQEDPDAELAVLEAQIERYTGKKISLGDQQEQVEDSEKEARSESSE